ncbi:hypothetical protein ROZALSC1DRAFT_27264 [Rozella allomycis CSF55]|uniref:Sperm-tail PG-rich repeat-containing protein 2 n=1 Tax=Rozella allomycis (strain CSF55) TaxID=988480 RepID=A0A075AWK5_ROZAC|nr:hypothetical protein O9G_001904 [Rozella allomycis CSF55]RKP21334.1 hypothetical protein ROZALSC1DRAFT_27264 [Rozella allomycis CSF55]|eukprot:EPZ34602.1 hypothetical protein O9G_001904 [Rozella allomycis CSF55]
MYSRTERITTFHCHETAKYPNLAPGVYENGESKIKKSYAPFSNLSKKESIFDEYAQEGPAPANYDINTCTFSDRSSIFGRSKRFIKDENSTPAPTAYYPKSQILAQGKPPLTAYMRKCINASLLVPDLEKSESERCQIHWTRKELPPSIPYGDYAEGYDIHENGSLRRRTSNRFKYSCPELRGFVEEDKTHHKGTSFGNSRTPKGQYHKAKAFVDNKEKKTKKNISKECMNQLLNDANVNSLRFTEMVSKQANKQSKGHEVTNGIYLGVQLNNEFPGPSAYYPKPPKTAPAKIAGSTSRNAIQSRYSYLAQCNPETGPGSYDIESKTSLGSSLMKNKNKGSGKPFNVSSLRFNYKQPPPTPGPCEFQENRVNKKNKYCAPFQSSADRFNKNEESQPAPGDYELDRSYKTVTEKGLWWLNHSLLASGTKREIFQNRNIDIPGPSSYNPRLLDKQQIDVDIYKHTTIDERFQAKVNNFPAPGYYGKDESYSNSLLKKTYNVTFDPPKSAVV